MTQSPGLSVGDTEVASHGSSIGTCHQRIAVARANPTKQPARIAVHTMKRMTLRMLRPFYPERADDLELLVVASRFRPMAVNSAEASAARLPASVDAEGI
jgi:hypothetical protein